jgi:hypothetical protein
LQLLCRQTRHSCDLQRQHAVCCRHTVTGVETAGLYSVLALPQPKALHSPAALPAVGGHALHSCRARRRVPLQTALQSLLRSTSCRQVF